LLVNYSRTQSM